MKYSISQSRINEMLERIGVEVAERRVVGVYLQVNGDDVAYRYMTLKDGYFSPITELELGTSIDIEIGKLKRQIAELEQIRRP